jgi:hypothetical protein
MPELIDIVYGALCIILKKPITGERPQMALPAGSVNLTLRVVLITRKLQYGSSKETSTRNGNQKVRSSGFTESVHPVPISMPYSPMTS